MCRNLLPSPTPRPQQYPSVLGHRAAAHQGDNWVRGVVNHRFSSPACTLWAGLVSGWRKSLTILGWHLIQYHSGLLLIKRQLPQNQTYLATVVSIYAPCFSFICPFFNISASGIFVISPNFRGNSVCGLFMFVPACFPIFFLLCCGAGWRSCSYALTSTVVWVPPVWRAPPCVCFTSPTTASRTGPRSASLAPCSPACTLWSWPTTTWPPFRTTRISCDGSSPTYAASTCTTQVSGSECWLVVCVCVCVLV